MSGPLPDWHRIKWRGDSGLNDGCSVGYDLTGGFYDAGDFLKIHFPQSHALNVLAWGMAEFKSGYTAAGQFDNSLRILKWGIDHFKKCHPVDHPLYPNIFFGQIGNSNIDHSSWGRPEDMEMERPVYEISEQKPGTELAAGVAASFASAALVFGQHWGWQDSYAQDCLKRARELLSFGVEHLGTYHLAIPDAVNSYKSWGGYNDEIVLAAAWIAKASFFLENSKYSADVARAVSLYSQFTPPPAYEFSWENKGAGSEYLMWQLTGDSKYLNAFDDFLNRIESGNKTPGGMYFIQQWGSARHAANVAFLFALNGQLQAAKEQIDFILGHGKNGQPIIDGQPGSYLVGYGDVYPTEPHHASASCPATGVDCNWNTFNAQGPNSWILHGALVGKFYFISSIQ